MPGTVATVVVVNYNGAHLLPACLGGLRRQDVPAGTFRTVVVDNASTDGSLALLARDFPEVAVVASTVNTGFAGGNDLALRALATAYAVLLNTDAVPEPSWLRCLLAPFAAPGSARLGVVTGKVLFAPRFLPLALRAPASRLGARSVGVRLSAVEVDGRDVTAKVLWEKAAYGPEGGFRWTRPAGPFLVPVQDGPGPLAAPATITVRWLDHDRPLTVECSTLDGPPLSSSAVGGRLSITVPAGTPLLDVVNNAGGIVRTDGYGTDRGFEEPDTGAYDEPAEVFAACGNGMAIRAEAGRDAGWFDPAFFLYYEDTDLCWRLRARGWSIRYEPAAVLRHLHSASVAEDSPLWRFHTDRNRLLMLTKNATAPLALRAVLRYPLTSASMLARAGRPGFDPAPHRLRGRVLLSYLRLLPAMLRARRRERRAATVDRHTLQQGLSRPPARTRRGSVRRSGAR